MNFRNKLLVILAVLLFPVAAAAQGVLQAGPSAPARVPMYVGGFGNAQTIIQDSGGAGGGPPGTGLNELGLTIRSPTNMYPAANAGNGPYGTNWCDYDAPTTNVTGYHFLCLSPNAQGGGLLAYGAAGGATQLPFNISINGVTYSFPFSLNGILGPPTTTVGDLAEWNNTTGTLLKDVPLSSLTFQPSQINACAVVASRAVAIGTSFSSSQGCVHTAAYSTPGDGGGAIYYTSSGAAFTGTISGTSLTVSGVTGSIALGTVVSGVGLPSALPVTIVSGTNPYTLSYAPGNVGPEAMQAISPGGFQSSDGQYWTYVVQGNLHPEQFGCFPSGTYGSATPGTDCTPGWEMAKLVQNMNVGGTLSAPPIEFQNASYWWANTVTITKKVSIKGTCSGTANGKYGSNWQFPAATAGIVFGAGSDGSIVDGICITGPSTQRGLISGGADAIHIKVPVTMRNVFAQYWTGNCVTIDGNAGNADSWRIDTLNCFYAHWMIYAATGNVDQGLGTSLNGFNLTAGCIFDSDIGSTFVMINCNSYAQGYSGVVQYSGTAYAMIDPNGLGSVTTPGTDPTVWCPIGSPSGSTPTWTGGGTYEVETSLWAGKPAHNPGAWSTPFSLFLNLYSEGIGDPHLAVGFGAYVASAAQLIEISGQALAICGSNLQNINASGGFQFSSGVVSGGSVIANGVVTTTVGFQAGAALPTISSCGTSPPAPTQGSSNNGGQFVTGSSSTTACTVTFATPFPVNAYCTVSLDGAANSGLYISGMARTGFTVAYTAATSLGINYSCNGN